MPAKQQPTNDYLIYRGLILTESPKPVDQRKYLNNIPPPPPWRTFSKSIDEWKKEAEEAIKNMAQKETTPDPRALGFVPDKDKVVELVNAAFCLRRPLLIEGRPGSGKTSLAYAIASELGLPGPYRWSIVSRTTLKEGLYAYDAIGRLQEASLINLKYKESGEYKEPDIGDYLRLGPMGMAFYKSVPGIPAVLLIDEIDKSDVDMPNDLLHIFEDGFFEIPELTRLKEDNPEILPYRSGAEDENKKIPIPKGCVKCKEFPLVIMTSNETREFPPAFLRRCLRLTLEQPKTPEGFSEIIKHRFTEEAIKGLDDPQKELINDFVKRLNSNDFLATDQLLNAVYLLTQGLDLTEPQRKTLLEAVFRSLKS